MPLRRRPYTGPYDHEPHRNWPLALGALAALLIAGVIGWAIGNAGGGSSSTTRTVTHTVTTAMAPSSVSEHTPAGAVAAAEANLVQAETSCVAGDRASPPRRTRSVPTAAACGHSPTGSRATARLMRSSRRGSSGSRQADPAPSQLAWELADVPVIWNGSRWTQSGQVTQLAADPHRLRTRSTGAASESFAQAIARLPEVPRCSMRR